MPCIIIQNLFNKTVEVHDRTKPLLYQFQQQHIDWMHSCGGKGRCTTCKVIVVKGIGNLEEPTVAEVNYAARNLLKANERLACQVSIRGDITIVVPEECKLPHIRYGE